MARSKGKVCYYCGQAAPGQEHVPPQQMFKAFDCDSITVPSCEDHNTSKSFDDQTIIDLLMHGVDWQRRRASISQHAAEALSLRSSSFSHTKRRIDYAHLVDHPMLPTIPYLEPGPDIYSWMQWIVAALVFDGAGFRDPSIHWPAAIVFSPSFLPGPKALSIPLEDAAQWLRDRQQIADDADRSFEWSEGWSAQPKPYPADVFAFDVGFHDQGFVGLRLRFYGESRWYVVTHMSGRTRRALRQRLATV
ncbi:MAG TPA: hypothetical protein VMW79_09020 [Anaerolineae bacterium]|nr:hypothetical protein [Anaerolineae bacterium]HUW96408.1 hypothetical protein [Anaerolineae bacterium]